MTLVEFLRARLDEDERGADDVHLTTCETVAYQISFPCDCHHPARVLAEVAAKRAIVASYESWVAGNTSGEMREFGHAEGLAEAVEHLATVYAGHPDYREGWKP